MLKLISLKYARKYSKNKKEKCVNKIKLLTSMILFNSL